MFWFAGNSARPVRVPLLTLDLPSQNQPRLCDSLRLSVCFWRHSEAWSFYRPVQTSRASGCIWSSIRDNCSESDVTLLVKDAMSASGCESSCSRLETR